MSQEDPRRTERHNMTKPSMLITHHYKRGDIRVTSGWWQWCWSSWSPNSNDLHFWYLFVNRQIQKTSASVEYDDDEDGELMTNWTRFTHFIQVHPTSSAAIKPSGNPRKPRMKMMRIKETQNQISEKSLVVFLRILTVRGQWRQKCWNSVAQVNSITKWEMTKQNKMLENLENSSKYWKYSKSWKC